MSSTGSRRDALGVFAFTIEIDGVSNLRSNFFRSCSGLKNETEIVEYREGGANAAAHKLIGPTKYPNLVLKEGFEGSPYALWKWRQGYIDAASDTSTKLKRHSGSIIMLGPGGKTMAKWKFKDAWPVKWEGPELDATKNELAIETVEIAHEGLTLESK